MHTVFKVAHQPGAMAAHAGLGAARRCETPRWPRWWRRMAIAVALGFMQTGGLFSFEALKLDPQKLMPSLKKVFNVDALMEVVKGFVKITLAAAVAWLAVKPLLGAFVNLTGASPRSILVVLGYATEKLGKQMALVVVVIGVGGFAVAAAPVPQEDADDPRRGEAGVQGVTRAIPSTNMSASACTRSSSSNEWSTPSEKLTSSW